MSDRTNYINCLTYENSFWRSKYVELWNNYVILMNEKNRISSLLNDSCSQNIVKNDNSNEEFVNIGNENQENQDMNIITHLQNKNAELVNTVLNKTREINGLYREFKKYKIPNSPPPTVDISLNPPPKIQ